MVKKINNNSILIELLKVNPIAYNPVLGEIAKSATAGLFLSQLLYWDGKGSDTTWIYKTIKEFEEETALNRSEQDRSIKIWTDMGIITTDISGVPPVRFFRIHGDKLADVINLHIGKTLIDCDTENVV